MMHTDKMLKSLCTLCVSLLVNSCGPADSETPVAAEPAPAAEPPNVLMIIVDDLNDWVGVMGGHPDSKTPNMDRLASEGTLFMNAHATAAICGPSRASVMTGLRPSTTGIYEQLSDKEIKQAGPATENITFMSEYFAEHGYKTMGIGKIFHNGAPEGSFEVYGGRIKGFGPHPPDEFVWHSDRTNTDWG
ncbi:MAG: sulfatase-like hydrolase/transferase, partial [Xanthomonadales bacterium]|nr:sulfatase-like hydrolase/transferase [Xanthomonadales bacterium]